MMGSPQHIEILLLLLLKSRSSGSDFLTARDFSGLLLVTFVFTATKFLNSDSLKIPLMASAHHCARSRKPNLAQNVKFPELSARFLILTLPLHIHPLLASLPSWSLPSPSNPPISLTH